MSQPPLRFRYEEVADFVAGLAGRGTLRPGARAPSLREISTQQRTSLRTAVQAYRLLEDRGILEVRPQSGYYVAKAPPALPVPTTTRHSVRPAKVELSGLMLSLLEHASDEALFEQALIELVLDGKVEREVAANAATNVHDFEVALDHALKRQTVEVAQEEAEAAEAAADEAEDEAPALRVIRAAEA